MKLSWKNLSIFLWNHFIRFEVDGNKWEYEK